MIDNRELLWRAWPDGYLAMRGLRTIAGWQCVGIGADESLWLSPSVGARRGLAPVQGVPDLVSGLPSGGPPFEHRSRWREDMSLFRLSAELGELLPAVDPSDRASWACVLADLAAGLGWAADQDLTWRMVKRGKWILTSHAADLASQLPAFFEAISRDDEGRARAIAGIEPMESFTVDSIDPATALVLARIQVRERSS